MIMATAIVLVNTETGSEDDVVESLRKLDAVKEAYVSYGVYDIVAKVEGKTLGNLKEIITHKVRKQDNVRSTLTLIVVE